MISHLIFDLDGTLVDSLRGIADSLNRTLKAHGLPGHADANVRGFIGDGLRNLIARAVPAGFPPESIDSLLCFYRADYQDSWRTGSAPYPGVPELLASLRDAGVPMAVLSNKVHDFTVEMVRDLLPDIPFAAILGQREGIPHKPDPVGALELAHQLGTAPAACAIIGDSTVDLETARRAGMSSIAVSWGYHDRDALVRAGAGTIVDAVADLAAELKPLLDRP